VLVDGAMFLCAKTEIWSALRARSRRTPRSGQSASRRPRVSPISGCACPWLESNAREDRRRVAICHTYDYQQINGQIVGAPRALAKSR
jgi:hypothetical protein